MFLNWLIVWWFYVFHSFEFQDILRNDAKRWTMAAHKKNGREFESMCIRKRNELDEP